MVTRWRIWPERSRFVLFFRRTGRIFASVVAEAGQRVASVAIHYRAWGIRLTIGTAYTSRALLPVAAALIVACFCVPAVAQTVRLVAFGDSNTYGYKIDRASTYPTQLQEMLQAQGYDVTIRNSGVNGDMTVDALTRLDRAIPEGTDGVILFLGRNDWRKGMPASAIIHNLETILGYLKQRDIDVLLVGFKPQNFSALAKQYGALYYPDFFDGVMILGRKMRRYRLGDVFGHLNRDGYAVVSRRMLPSVEKLIARIAEQG